MGKGAGSDVFLQVCAEGHGGVAAVAGEGVNAGEGGELSWGELDGAGFQKRHDELTDEMMRLGYWAFQPD